MLHMVIAEDEYRIRCGLVGLPWETLDIRAYAAENGLEAMDLIHRVHPSILLTDIRMPDMNGLALIETAQTECPDLRSMILTGYRDFEYAQSAIRLKVADYILKPSSPHEIMRKVQEIADAVRAEEMHLSQRSALTELYENNIHPYEQPLRLAFAGKKAGYDALRNLLPEGLKSDGLLVAALPLDHGQNIGDFSAMAGGQAYPPFCWTLSDDGKMMLLVYAGAGDQMRNAVIALAGAARTDGHVGLCTPRQSVERISEGKDAAIRCASLFFSHPELRVVTEDELDGGSPELSAVNASCAEILTMAKQWNYRGVSRQLEQLTGCLRHSVAVEERHIKNMFFDMCAAVHRICCEKTGEKNLLLPKEIYVHINEAQTLEELRALAEEYLWEKIDEMNARKLSVNPLTEEISAYIHENSHRDLMLEDVSAQVHASPGYVCKLLRRDLNTTFVQLLTQERMKNACELLAGTALPVGEVAQRVGFPDAKYFAMLFKRQYGMTPVQYRRKDGEAERSPEA